MGTQETILLTNQKAVLFDAQKIETLDLKESKKYPTGMLVPLNVLSTLSFSIPKSFNDEELAIQVEIKMYKEGGLDVDAEYVIDYIKFELEENFFVEAFALQKEKFYEIAEPYVKKVAAIDYAFVHFLSYQTLYKCCGYSTKGNDLFIYIDEEEAFGAIYSKGKYIGHRTLNSLSSLSKRTGVELVKLKEYLLERGLQRANYSGDELPVIDAIQAVLLKDIEKLVYSVNHKRTTFGISGIDNIYIDFFDGTIEGLGDLFVPFGYEDLKPKPIVIEQKEQNIATRLYINLQYLYDIVNGSDYQLLNLTLLERKKPLKEYIVFRYIFLFFLSLVICGALFAYLGGEKQKLQEIIAQKKSLLKKAKTNSKKLQVTLKKFKEEHKKLLKELREIESKNRIYEGTLQLLPVVEDQKRQRQQFMNDVMAVLAKYRLNTKDIKQLDEKNMQITIISESDQRDRIAKFINALIKKNYASVTTNKIVKDEELELYSSEIRISR